MKADSRTWIAAALLAFGGAAATLPAQGPPAAAPVAPVNQLPNPWRTIEGWARMPAGRSWGSTSGVDVAPDGRSIWVAERCGTNSCSGSTLDPILHFDSTGTLIRSFGAGMLLTPHGLHVDREGNVWVTDCACTGTAEQRNLPGKGHQVYKFSPEGKLLLTLGAPGGGRDSAYFWQPNAVLTLPDGDVLVAEGHSSAAGANARILRFDRNGKYKGSIGKRGTGHGEFDQPHTLALDSQGRLFVGDRSNNRIQILRLDGTWLAEWPQFSRPSGIYIRHDTLYVSDSESGSVNPAHGAWLRGIRIGDARTGAVWHFIPDPNTQATNTSAAEGIAVDARGAIYGAEVGAKRLQKYVRP